MPSSLGSKTVNISLPLLVRDWLKKRCPEQHCFWLRESFDIGLDIKNNESEETLSQLLVQSKHFRGGLINSDQLGREYSEVLFDYEIGVTKTSVNVSLQFNKYKNLDWRAPSFWQQLGKILKCPH